MSSHDYVLIKLGGSILHNLDLIKKICADLINIKMTGTAILIVHGGGKAIDKMLKIYNITSTIHEGIRITTNEMIGIVEMVLCGQINKTLVRTFNAAGIPAVGLSGSDNNMLPCELLNAIHGKVGKITHVNTEIIQYFLQTQKDHKNGIIPIIAPVGIDNNGNALNINADWAAVHIALALKIKKLIFLTDQDGIYDHAKKTLTQLGLFDLQSLIESQTVQDGMLIKTKAIIKALKQGIETIHITNATTENALASLLISGNNVGTTCRMYAANTNEVLP